MSTIAMLVGPWLALIAVVMVYRRLRLWYWDRHLRGWSPEGIAALDAVIDGTHAPADDGYGRHTITVGEPFKPADGVMAYLEPKADTEPEATGVSAQTGVQPLPYQRPHRLDHGRSLVALTRSLGGGARLRSRRDEGHRTVAGRSGASALDHRSEVREHQGVDPCARPRRSPSPDGRRPPRYSFRPLLTLDRR